MNNIQDFLLEKLIISKNLKPNKTDDYWYGDINSQGDMKDDFFNNRKLKRKTNEHGELKNRPWFAVYLYLSKNGPQKVSQIKQDLWPDSTSQRAMFFTDLRSYHIIKSNKGFQEICPYSEWIYYKGL